MKGKLNWAAVLKKAQIKKESDEGAIYILVGVKKDFEIVIECHILLDKAKQRLLSLEADGFAVFSKTFLIDDLEDSSS